MASTAAAVAAASTVAATPSRDPIATTTTPDKEAGANSLGIPPQDGAAVGKLNPSLHFRAVYRNNLEPINPETVGHRP